MKIVIYNGLYDIFKNNQIIPNGSRYSELVYGYKYQVEKILNKGWVTVYKLIGINGLFNSIYFDECEE